MITKTDALPPTITAENALIGESRWKVRRNAEKILRETEGHPLKFLLNQDGKFHKTRGVKHYELCDRPDLVQMGHVKSNKLGGEELIALQSAWENQFMNQTLERPSRGGAVLHTPSVVIDQVPVSQSTAKFWEEVGFLEKGTVEKAPVVIFK